MILIGNGRVITNDNNNTFIEKFITNKEKFFICSESMVARLIPHGNLLSLIKT